MRELVSYTDFLVICTARNERQAQGDRRRGEAAGEAGDGPAARAAPREAGAGWVVLDYLDCVLHVFTARGAPALPARGALARGAAPGARPRRARSALGRQRLSSGRWRLGAACAKAVRGRPTVPRMGSFKRALLGYRRATSRRRSRPGTHRYSEREMKPRPSGDAAIAELEQELSSLSGMVIEREREIRGLGERLREANERHDRSIASLEAISGRLEEIQAQARGQATRIRMKALREAVEVSRQGAGAERGRRRRRGRRRGGPGAADFDGLFEGLVKLEIGPLGDFSQLVGFEDAVGRLGASEISVERFSEGRATLSMRLDQPVELLRELEELSPLDFKVRRTAPDNLILDVDEDQGRAARRLALGGFAHLRACS